MRKISLICCFSAIFALFSISAFAADGAQIYKEKCASCHKLDKPSTGPALKGAKQRWADAGEAELIYKWVQNNGSLRSSGESKRAISVFNEWKGAAMTAFPTLSVEDIDAVLDYADAYTPPVAAVTGGAGDVGAGKDKGGIPIWLVVLVVVLAVVAFVAFGARKKVEEIQRAAKGEEVKDERTLADKFGVWIVKNWLFGLVIFVALFFSGISDLFTRLATIGVYEDYQPSQVVAYDHSLHAGKMEIDCRYCHNSVEKSKHAGLPTTNVCMNCHTQVWETAKGTGAEEISKLHAAAGFDKESKSYNKDAAGNVITGDPIVWNKAHNLPDHVFFSHKQHVKVGGIDCMQCHGDVKSYTLGRVSTLEEINELAKDPKHSDKNLIPLTKPLLTMGWCIECHGKKQIEVGPDAANPYYQEIHNRLTLRPDVYKKIKDDGEITVKELGGWECAKCHY